jgi:hypothetical protein
MAINPMMLAGGPPGPEVPPNASITSRDVGSSPPGR